MALMVDIRRLKPQSARVTVGDLDFEIRTPTIDRAELFFEALAGVEIEKVVAPVVGLIRRVMAKMKGGGADADKLREVVTRKMADAAARGADAAEIDAIKEDGIRQINAIAEQRLESMFSLIEGEAEAVIAILRPVLGKSLGPTLRECVIAILDTEGMRRMLTAPTVIGDKEGPAPLSVKGDADVERDGDGMYMGSSAVRVWIKQSCTLPQAVHVITTAIRVADFASLGKLLGGLTGPAETPPEEQGNPAATVA